MSCTKCNSSLVTLNTSTNVNTCNACGTAWSVVPSLQCNGCNGCNGAVNMNRKLRMIKDGKTGWHQCENCGMYANIDDKRDVIIMLDRVEQVNSTRTL